jgi:hypothetical protein
MKPGQIWIRPLDRTLLVKAVLASLEGDSIVVLEGDLRSFAFSTDTQVALPPSFQRESPDTPNCIALRLDRGDAQRVFRTLTGTPGWSGRVEAMQIHHKAARAFVAGDSFHDECVSLWPAAPQGLLERLVSEGVAERL